MLFCWFLCFYRNQKILSICIPLVGFLNFQLNTTSFLEVDTPKNGIGLFRIESLRLSSFNLYLYKGKLISFESEGKYYYNIPCTIAYRAKNKPLSSYDYLIEGTLTKRAKFFSFKPKKNTTWIKDSKRYNFNELRFKFKKKFKIYLSKKIKGFQSSSLISALITGEVDNKLLRFSFSRLGLSHVLAISGFHFALVIGFFTFFLSKILSKRLFLFALIIISIAYFLFIGMSPSVFRAFTLVIMYIFAKLLHKDASAMNLMGVSILLNLIFLPSDVYHLGFQLSYLSYSAIIIFYPIFHNLLKKVIKDHDKRQLSFLSKIAYKILQYFRSSISLDLAVNMVLVFVLLFYFSKFPLYSLIYNLFIPLLISFLLYLTIIACFIPYLFHLVTIFSNLLLRVITYPPAICEYTINYKDLNINFLLFFLIIIFSYGVIRLENTNI
jgi:competence protein ComEC